MVEVLIILDRGIRYMQFLLFLGCMHLHESMSEWTALVLTFSLSQTILWNPSPDPRSPNFAFLESILAYLRKVVSSGHYDTYLIAAVSSDKEQEQILQLLKGSGLYGSGLDSRKVLFCETEEGKAHIVRHVEPHIHIETNDEIIQKLAPFVPKIVRLKRVSSGKSHIGSGSKRADDGTLASQTGTSVGGSASSLTSLNSSLQHPQRRRVTGQSGSLSRKGSYSSLALPTASASSSSSALSSLGTATTDSISAQRKVQNTVNDTGAGAGSDVEPTPVIAELLRRGNVQFSESLNEKKSPYTSISKSPAPRFEMEDKKDHIAVTVDAPTVAPSSSSSGGKPSTDSNNTYKSPPMSLTWNDVSYTVPVGKNQTRTLLKNMSGEVRSGEVVAIMGGSGAGKSTLLNCLAGRIGPGVIEGEILVNGAPRNKKTWQSLCAYVEQDDIMYSNLTVTETLQYSALLRLPSKSLSRREKLDRVENIIMELGLNGCRNTYIGNSMVRGVSGGERKRVAIGVELVTQPKILFLDEPTSGLDAFTAFNIIETIKNLAVTHNMVVLMTIHQPRTDILELFDKILLLSAGRTVFFGPLSGSLSHFESLGFPLPPKTNPSDFFLDIITLDQRSDELKEESLKRINMFHEAWESKKNRFLLDGKDVPDTVVISTDEKKGAELAVPVPKGSKWPSSWIGEFWTLLDRNMKDVRRDKATIGATIGQGIIIMLVMGFIFFKVTDDAAGVQNRIGVLFFICVNQTFGVVMPTLGIFPDQRQIIKRERAAGTYRASSAFLAKLVSTLPLNILGSLLLAVPVYWMIGLRNDIVKYFIFILIVIIHSTTANSLGLAIGSAVPNSRVGQIVGPLVIVLFLLFGGQLLNLDNVPQVFRWIQWISIIAYSNKALAQNELRGLPLRCTPGSAALCYDNGDQVLSSFGLESPSLWYCILINVGLSVGFLVIGFLLFNRTSRPLMRLS
ncbi:ATP-binding cassette sub- G member 2 [Quaeritorhiza haematococci]|nr:ATP-binding cassette sub- G member 2 [Quaeritorhiza haematococci]